MQILLVSCILVLPTWQAVSSVANRAEDKGDVDLEADQEVEISIRVLQPRVGVKLGFSPSPTKMLKLPMQLWQVFF